MNKVMRFFLFFLAALCAFPVVADDWDFAMDEMAREDDDGQSLAAEVARIRTEKGERFQFLPPPDGAQLFLAKDFSIPASSNWKAGKDSLTSKGGAKGNVSFTYRPAKKGVQYVWVYLLDWKREGKGKGTGELDVIATQAGSRAGTMKLYRSMSPLSTDAGVKKYGVKERPWPSYVWQDGFFEAKSTGEVELEFAVREGSYDVKAVVVTDDPTYEPRLADFYPMWIKVKAASTMKAPAKCSLYMRHGIDKSWYYLFPEKLEPGADTGWFYCSRFLPYGTRTIQVTLDDGAKPAGDAQFEVLVSRTGRDDDLLFQCVQQGGGCCKSIRFEEIVMHPAGDRIAVDDDVSSSRKSLAEARSLSAQKGAEPKRFEFQMDFKLDEKNGETFRNEDAMRKAIGCRKMPTAPSPLGYYQASYDKCICTPNRERIVKNAAAVADVKGPSVSWFMDEPGGAVTKGCANCRAHFAEFLKEHGIAPKSLGYKSAADVAPVFSMSAEEQERELPQASAGLSGNLELEDGDGLLDLNESAPQRLDPKKATERYYWSRRYETTTLRRFYAFATAEVTKHNQDVRTTATLSPDYVDKCNSVAHRIDWFDLFENGGLTFAQTEDWCNVADDYQVCGYLTDFIRGAARRRDIPVSVYDIMPGRDARTIATKAFTEVAHGARRVNFWGYGPAYMVAEYSASDIPGLRAAIKSVTWPVGACEKTLLDGQRVRGDIAYLYSATTDILDGVPAADTDVRAAAGANASCGMERMWVDVLLTQCGFSTDVIDENGVNDFLKDYACLWTAEMNLRKEALAPLVAWIKDGGTLVLGPGALVRDEYNRPLGFDETVGLVREPFSYHTLKNPEKIGGTVAAKGIAKISSGRSVASFASGAGAAYEIAVGKGTVIALAFSPGMSYWWSGKSGKGFYAPDLRDFVKALLPDVARTVSADDHRVEARLFKGAGEDVLVIANWAKDDLEKVTVTLPAGYAGAESFISRATLSGNKLTLFGLGPGDCIRLRCL